MKKFLMVILGGLLIASCAQAGWLSKNTWQSMREKTSGESELIWLVRSNNLPRIKELINSGNNVLVANAKGETALTIAAKDNPNWDMVEVLAYEELSKKGHLSPEVLAFAITYNPNKNIYKNLVAMGADVNARTQFGFTPLMLLALSRVQDVEERIKFLLNYGAEVNERYMIGSYSGESFYGLDKVEKIVETQQAPLSALSLALLHNNGRNSKNMVQTLYGNGAKFIPEEYIDTNGKDLFERYHKLEIKNHYPEFVGRLAAAQKAPEKKLVEEKITPSVRRVEDVNALMLKRIKERLSKGIKPSFEEVINVAKNNMDVETLWFLYNSLGKAEEKELLIKSLPPQGDWLQKLVLKKLPLSELNLDYNVDFYLNVATNPIGARPQNPLFLFEAKQPNPNLDVLDKLLAEGADVNTKDWYGRTAIQYLAANNKMDLVQALIDKGANAKLKDRFENLVSDYYPLREDLKTIFGASTKGTRVYSQICEVYKSNIDSSNNLILNEETCSPKEAFRAYPGFKAWTMVDIKESMLVDDLIIDFENVRVQGKKINIFHNLKVWGSKAKEVKVSIVSLVDFVGEDKTAIFDKNVDLQVEMIKSHLERCGQRDENGDILFVPCGVGEDE